MEVLINGIKASGAFPDTEVWTRVMSERLAEHAHLLYEIQSYEHIWPLGMLKYNIDKTMNKPSSLLVKYTGRQDEEVSNKNNTQEYFAHVVVGQMGFGTTPESKIYIWEPHSQKIIDLLIKEGALPESVEPMYLAEQWVAEHMESGVITPDSNLVFPDFGSLGRFIGQPYIEAMSDVNTNILKDVPANLIVYDKERGRTGQVSRQDHAYGKVNRGQDMFMFDDVCATGGSAAGAGLQMQDFGSGPLKKAFFPHFMPLALKSQMIINGGDLEKAPDYSIMLTDSCVSEKMVRELRLENKFEFNSPMQNYDDYKLGKS